MPQSGGLLARLLSRSGSYQNPSSYVSRRYPRGRFNRIITIGSPHNGTVLEYYTASLSRGAGLYPLIPWILQANGLLQDKFNPFGPQIQSLNSVPADSRARFHMISATLEVPGQSASLPLAYGILGLGMPAGTGMTKKDTLLPLGSDGVVDYESQNAAAVNRTTYMNTRLASGFSHSGPEWFFGVPGGSTETSSAAVADRVVELLDGPSSEFGPFINPTLLTAQRKSEIDALVPTTLTTSLAASGIAGGAALKPASITLLGVTNSFTLTVQPLVSEPLQGTVNWFAEVFGTDGVASSNVTLTVNSTDSTRATILVPDTVVGDVVVYTSYVSTSGKLIVGNPIVVVTQRGGAAMTNLVVLPATATLRPGEQIRVELWGQFNNGTRQQLFIAPGSPITVSNSNPAAVTADTNLTVTAVAGGVATVGYQYQGFSNSLSVTVVQPLVVGLQPANQSGTNGVTLSLSVNVSGDGPIGYQWLKDGLPMTDGSGVSGVSTNTLQFNNAARSQSGIYTLVASNAVGIVVSSNAVVRVRVPQRLVPTLMSQAPGTAFRLAFQDSDGGVLSANDVPNFEVHYTTNFFGANTAWVTNTSGFSVSNGIVTFDDAGSSNAVRRFYRVIEK